MYECIIAFAVDEVTEILRAQRGGYRRGPRGNPHWQKEYIYRGNPYR